MLEMLKINAAVKSMPEIDDTDGQMLVTKFDFGDIENLQSFVVSNGHNVYPLIFCPNDYSLKTLDNNTKSGDLTFIVATNNDNINMSNLERLNTTFKLVLKPVVKEFLLTLKGSGDISINDEIFGEFNYYGYDVMKGYNDNLGLSENWDAYKFRVNLSFKDC